MLTIATACVLGASGALAQEPRERVSVGEGQAGEVRVNVAPRVALEHTVKGAPYSADTITENTQSLADGNRIAKKVTGRVYRDGEGRVRREEDRADGTVAISIVDPVANVSYRLEPESHVAWKTDMNVGVAIMDKVQIEERRRAEEARLGRGGREPSGGEAVTVMRGGMVVSMGEPGPIEKKTIEGIPVEGRKRTTTIPAGQIGNEQPITVTTEEWSSPDLKILVLTRYSDPRMGESSYHLTNIVRAEPDPSLFQVPAGYTIKETGIRRHEQSK